MARNCYLLWWVCMFSMFLSMQWLWLYQRAHQLADAGPVINFGYEYGQIAASLASGQGYGNVFDPTSGPTAWQLPFIVWVFTLVFMVFGSQTVASAFALFAIKAALVSGACLWPAKILENSSFKRYWPLPTLLLAGYIFLNDPLWKDFDDVPFIWFGSFWMIYVIGEIRQGKTMFWHVLAISILAPLTTPALALTWVVLFLVVFLQALRQLKPFSFHTIAQFLGLPVARMAFLAGACFLLSVAGWGYHNWQIFQKLLLSKSNLWFEFYLANVVEEDGLLSTATLYMHHPNSPYTAVFQEYLSEGEMAFLEKYQQIGRQSLQAQPRVYLEKTWNRIQAVLVYTKDIGNTLPAPMHLLDAEAQEKLAGLGLFSPRNQGKWTYLDRYDREEFRKAIAPLALANEEALVQDWQQKRGQMKAKQQKAKTILNGLLLSSVPFVCLLCCMCIPLLRKQPFLQYTGYSFAVFVLPYILVSHYPRYQQFLLMFHCLFITLLVAFVADYLLRKKQQPTS